MTSPKELFEFYSSRENAVVKKSGNMYEMTTTVHVIENGEHVAYCKSVDPSGVYYYKAD
ncbi:hypothetical protein KNT64_gp009 [Pseudomonas phage PspYZU05]|uniref:Uncharacterized protein n=1 Tax=Pseudomonas phage PspYZU05 TaxID=1983556 RepID=A0A2U7NEY6_9CAUD|nr:hypothetical protein KNT64_gp009 [Pseudomonas phage PspYZU05]ASD51961.1 hypothetical protein PspYZU05_09 [Pseudomonas phage PspYZU05]